MNAAIEKRLGIVWLILSAITVAQFLSLQANASNIVGPHAVITVSVIGMALVKARLVFNEFMEVRHAPALFRRLADAWLVITTICLLGTYFAVPALITAPA